MLLIELKLGMNDVIYWYGSAFGLIKISWFVMVVSVMLASREHRNEGYLNSFQTYNRILERKKERNKERKKIN